MLTAHLCVHWKHIRFTCYSNSFHWKDTYYWSTALKRTTVFSAVKTSLLLFSPSTENSTCIWPRAKNVTQIYLFNCLLVKYTGMKRNYLWMSLNFATQTSCFSWLVCLSDMVTMTKQNKPHVNGTILFNFEQAQFHNVSKKGASSGHTSQVCPMIAFEINRFWTRNTFK